MTLPLQTSTKDNLPSENQQVKSPRKSILKGKIAPTPLQSRPSFSRRHQDSADASDAIIFPDLDDESPVPTIPIRQKSKSLEKPKTEGTSINPIRSISPLPGITETDPDLWTTVSQPMRPLSVAPEKREESSVKEGVDRKDLSNHMPADSAVLEIETVVRRDIERLRLDMIRQFVTFRDEIGKKWEGEVDRLRRDNEVLRKELNTLKKEQEKKVESGRWNLY
jgi:hypothetical protein